MHDNYRDFARRVIETMRDERRTLAARAAAIQAQGYRLVEAGETDGAKWQVIDALTGDVLASGTAAEEYAALELPFPVWNVDRIAWEVYTDTPYADLGLSAEDASHIQYMITEGSAGIASWLTGMPIAEVSWLEGRDETALAAPYNDADHEAAEAWLAAELKEDAS
jgi:hypothetical protein